MAEQDPTELVVAGSGDVYVADFGTALPTTEDTILAGFDKLGYVSEDGVTFNWSPNIEEYGAWQSRTPVRREMTAQDYSVSFQLEQWNDVNLGLAFGGGTSSTVSAGHYRFDFLADDDTIAEKSFVLDFNDGAKQFRLVIPRVNAVEGTEVQLQKASLATLAVSLKALAPGSGIKTAYFLTDDAAFNPAGS